LLQFKWMSTPKLIPYASIHESLMICGFV